MIMIDNPTPSKGNNTFQTGVLDTPAGLRDALQKASRLQGRLSTQVEMVQEWLDKEQLIAEGGQGHLSVQLREPAT